MIRQTSSTLREEIVARAVAPVVGELRLVDAADYVAFIRLEQRAALEDIVSSAAELFFMPGSLRLGASCEAELEWGGEPRITLDLEFCLKDATVYFHLVMEADRAGVDVTYASFAAPDPDEAKNTGFLAAALENMRIRPTAKPAACKPVKAPEPVRHAVEP